MSSESPLDILEDRTFEERLLDGDVTVEELCDALEAEKRAFATSQAALGEARATVRVMLRENGEESRRHEETKAHLLRSMQGELDALAEITRLKNDLDFATDCLNASDNTGRVMWQQRDKARSALETAKATAQEALQNLDESEEEVTKLKQQLERYGRLSDKNRRFAFLWKEYAKRLLIRARAWERATHETASQMKQPYVEIRQPQERPSEPVPPDSLG